MSIVFMSLSSLSRTLGSAVRNDHEIRGFKVLDAESKFSQCAEDTTLIFDGSESSFSRSLLLLDTFALMSGLKVFGLVRIKTWKILFHLPSHF